MSKINVELTPRQIFELVRLIAHICEDTDALASHYGDDVGARRTAMTAFNILRAEIGEIAPSELEENQDFFPAVFQLQAPSHFDELARACWDRLCSFVGDPSYSLIDHAVNTWEDRHSEKVEFKLCLHKYAPPEVLGEIRPKNTLL